MPGMGGSLTITYHGGNLLVAIATKRVLCLLVRELMQQQY